MHGTCGAFLFKGKDYLCTMHDSLDFFAAMAKAPGALELPYHKQVAATLRFLSQVVSFRANPLLLYSGLNSDTSGKEKQGRPETHIYAWADDTPADVAAKRRALGKLASLLASVQFRASSLRSKYESEIGQSDTSDKIPTPRERGAPQALGLPSPPTPAANPLESLYYPGFPDAEYVLPDSSPDKTLN